jgi:hypothetical protein
MRTKKAINRLFGGTIMPKSHPTFHRASARLSPRRLSARTLYGMAVFVCLLLCPIASGVSQEPKSETRTLRLVNGHGWAMFSYEGKIGYFLGLMDGWEARQGQEGSVKVALLLAMSTDHISLQNAVDLIDEGYKDPANIDLPVWWVFMAEVSIKRGDTSPDKAFTVLRHLLTQIAASTEVLPTDKWNEKFNPIDALNAAAKAK